MMKIRTIGLCLFLSLFTLFLSAPYAFADEKGYSNEPWERAGLYLGAFVLDTNSDLKLGAGVKVDAEDVLGLEENFTAFRADAFWRITRRNRVDFTYYKMNRNGSSFLGVEIPDGEGGSFPLGTKVKTDFDITVLRASYAYSFFKNEHFDLGVAGGLFGLKVDFKMDSDLFGKIEETDFTVPLPVVGLRGNFALTPKWFIRQSFDYFYINIGDYEGQLVDFNVALEWNALKHLGVGIGYNYALMDLKYSGSDDFLEEMNMSYGGVLLFTKLYF